MVPSPHENQKHVFILQHPQEPDKALGTAKLAHSILKNSSLKVALSCANLKKALKDESIQPARWGVLYLGSGIKGSVPKTPGLTVVKKNGEPLPDAEQSKTLSELEGIVILDGTWSQAKTLWWRNAWLLKLKRLILTPTGPSLYGKLRREPRGECLSTIETIAESLRFLGEDPAIESALKDAFKEHLKSFKKNPNG